MYSNKENVNILTALLVAHGVRHAVVCPGSRNAPIVHNLNEHPDIACHPVTDERSAGFYALGMALHLREPVGVCVTSGTALLNLLPAVAEACHQHVPLVVVSADRPPQWIGQQDGQTLPQADALGRFVKRAVSLPEPRDEEERWYCNRLVNEALLASGRQGGGPVHINVPISEPLYDFTVARLPEERVIAQTKPTIPLTVAVELRARMLAARRPLIVLGQMAEQRLYKHGFNTLTRKAVVLAEPLSCVSAALLDECLEAIGDDERYVPDFVLYGGGHVVSKRLKQFLRRAGQAEVWAVSEDGEVRDTFMHVSHVIEGSMAELLQMETPGPAGLDERLAEEAVHQDYNRLWVEAFDKVRRRYGEKSAAYSADGVVRRYEHRLSLLKPVAIRHYANSMSVRLGCRYSSQYIYCNRGVNGIEGTLSTAAGMSLVSSEDVCCVVGDLSFFYDQNALWNAALTGNLRILLLNNGGGAIFERFDGLRQSGAREMIVGRHSTRAADCCRQHGVDYRSAADMGEATEGIEWLLQPTAERPMLLEVFLPSR